MLSNKYLFPLVSLAPKCCWCQNRMSPSFLGIQLYETRRPDIYRKQVCGKDVINIIFFLFPLLFMLSLKCRGLWLVSSNHFHHHHPYKNTDQTAKIYNIIVVVFREWPIYTCRKDVTKTSWWTVTQPRLLWWAH